MTREGFTLPTKIKYIMALVNKNIYLKVPDLFSKFVLENDKKCTGNPGNILDFFTKNEWLPC